MKRWLLFAALCLIAYIGQAQTSSTFTPEQIQAIKLSCDSISGPGKPVKGDGSGGWRSGSAGVMYSGAYPPDPRWKPMAPSYTTGSAIKKGLLPPIKPLLELHLRDTEICLGGDGYYYMTGSSGDNIWAYAAGLELWRSRDLKKWAYMGVVWSIEKEGVWEKKWQNLHGKPARALWAPEIHYVKGNYFICLSMPPGGISILKSTTGKAEGPYVHATTVTDKPFVNGIDPTLFQDDDGAVYFTWSGGLRIARMKDDMTDFAEPFHQIVLANPDHDSTHHAAKCMGRGSNDLGHEGAVLFKANGKYYLGAADDYEGRYSTCVAVADNIYGPYRNRHETVPCGGGTGFFKDKKGEWWCSYFGNDNQSPWREKPGIVKVVFDNEGQNKSGTRPAGFYTGKKISGAFLFADIISDHVFFMIPAEVFMASSLPRSVQILFFIAAGDFQLWQLLTSKPAKYENVIFYRADRFFACNEFESAAARLSNRKRSV